MSEIVKKVITQAIEAHTAKYGPLPSHGSVELIEDITEAIAALRVGGERKWPDTICNDIDKLLRQHIRWTQGDHSEGTYIEGWRKAARAVEEYIQKMQRAPAPVAVTVLHGGLLVTVQVQHDGQCITHTQTALNMHDALLAFLKARDALDAEIEAAKKCPAHGPALAAEAG